MLWVNAEIRDLIVQGTYIRSGYTTIANQAKITR